MLKALPMPGITARLLVLLLLSTAVLLVWSAPAASGPIADPALRGGPTDQIIVSFASNASEAAIDALNRSEAVTQVEAIPALGLRVLRVPPGQDPAVVAARYARNALVQFAEVNALVSPEVIPNDPYYSEGWHLPKIEAPAAWDTARANGVMITICDTGILGSHPDLVGVLRADLGWNSVDGSNNWAPIMGHGTLVAGAAAAATNNGIGVSGVAWGASIVPVRISNRTDGAAFISDAAKCVQYGADVGARVINISYRMAGAQSLDTAGAYARNKGAVTLVAAGNDGIDPGWPNYAGFLAVSATTSSDGRASWSNYGSFVDVAAPGVSIVTTTDNGWYAYASGTSLASPVAAGVLALIFGSNPGISAAAAEGRLLSTADDLGPAGWDPYFGAGRVNARKAVSSGSTTPTPTPTATPTPVLQPTATATPFPTATPSPTPQPTATPVPGGVSVSDVSYWTTGGRNGNQHLRLSVSVENGSGQPVANASVSIRLVNGTRDWNMNGSTNSSGVASFSLNNAPPGCYTTSVTWLSVSWDGQTPSNVYCK
jgi:thermitase